MAFRKRNIAVGRPSAGGAGQPAVPESRPGIRPSPLTSHPVTSTGTPSLDGLLGGHAGLALGSSLLVEESGTTDFGGALLRYYAAEGICQGHVLHVVGMGEGWVRELPGVADEKKSSSRSAKPAAEEDKMKIAWRYEKLGQAGERALPDRTAPAASPASTAQVNTPFCHTFDLSKRISLSPDAKVNHISITPSFSLDSIIQNLSRVLATSAPHTIHRLVVPSLLSPALYSPLVGRPESFIRFFQSLRTLLRQHSTKLTALITLPLELYPRTSGLVRWAEILSDGVLELTPFPHLMDASNSLAESGGAREKDEQPQGLVRFHKLPINTERGEGGAGAGNSLGEDLAFTVSRRKFVIQPFSLPPVEGDQEAQQDAGKVTAKDMQF